MLGYDSALHSSRLHDFCGLVAQELLPFLQQLHPVAVSRARVLNRDPLGAPSVSSQFFSRDDDDDDPDRQDFLERLSERNDANVAHTVQAPQLRERMSTRIRIDEINTGANASLALKLPCHCLDEFRNGIRWSTISGRQEVFKMIDGVFFPVEGDSNSIHSSTFGHPNLKVVTLLGMEGVGKTRIAAEYILRNKSAFPVILWIDASTQESVSASYRAFAKRISLLSDSIAATAPDAVIKNNVQSWLSNPKDRGLTIPWLLVLDAANDLHVASDIWPHDAEGCLMVTTRQPAIVSTFATSEIEVEPLSSKDAAMMLLNLTGKRNETDAATNALKIAEAWEGLPGCMELVNMVVRSKRLSLADFAATQNMKKSQYLLEKPMHGSTKPSGAFAVLSGLAIESLEGRDEGELDLLFALSFFDGSHVDEEILRKHPSVATLDKFPRDVHSYVECRRRLWETSMVKHDDDLGELRVMTIVQDALLSRIKASGKELSHGFATANALVLSMWPCSITVEGSFSQIELSERWARCEKLAPHVQRLWRRYLELEGFEQKCAVRPFAQLLVEAAWFQVEKANAVAAWQLLDHGHTVYERAEREEQKSMLDILSALHNTKGAYFGRINEPKEASEAMGKYLEVQKQIQAISGEKPSAKLAAAYSEFALAQLERGQDQDVISLLRESSAMRRQLDTFTNLDLYNPLRYEGLYHMHASNWLEAERCFFTALGDRRAKYGVDDTRGARAGVLLSNIGDLHCRQHKWQDGYEYHERAHRSLTGAVGDDHLLTLRARVKVARDLIEVNKPGNLAQAKRLLEKCFTGYDQHVFVDGERARVLFLRGRVSEATGDGSASDLLEQAARMRDKLIQRPDSCTADTLTFADFDGVVPFGAR
ncbi:MAG: hypothetical protein Q9173_004727 [Seirophora scorigena]